MLDLTQAVIILVALSLTSMLLFSKASASP
jgi:hypothetical protein